MTLFEKIVQKDHLLASFHLIKEKWFDPHLEIYQFNTAGIDGFTLQAFEKDLERQLDECHAFLLNPESEFYPQILTRVPKKDPGKFRDIYLMTLRDKVIHKAIASVLEQKLDRHFYPNLYAFRRGKYYGSMPAGRKVRDYLNAHPGKAWVLKADISEYFDSIDPKLMMNLFEQYLPGEDTLLLYLRKYLRHRRTIKGIFQSPLLGVPTGSPLSPLCANLYLVDLDRQMFRAGIHYLRYCDDLLVMATSLEEVQAARQVISQSLADHKLRLSEKKTNIYAPGEGFDYLGYRFADLKVHVGEAAMKTFRDWIYELLPRERYRDIPNATPEERKASLKKILIDFNTGKLVENTNSLNQTQIPWIRSFPIVDCDQSFKDMDQFIKNRIRLVIMRSASRKSRQLIPEAWFRELGYKSLTNAYYRITRRRSLAPYYGWRRYFGSNFLEVLDPSKKKKGIARKWRDLKEKVNFVRKAIRGEI